MVENYITNVSFLAYNRNGKLGQLLIRRLENVSIEEFGNRLNKKSDLPHVKIPLFSS